MNCKKCGVKLNEEDYVFMGYCEKCYTTYIDSNVAQYNINAETQEKEETTLKQSNIRNNGQTNTKKFQTNEHIEHTNYIRNVKMFSNIFLILSIIGGIILANVYEITTITYYGNTKQEFNTILMLSSWVIGFISWVVMYGIACIVENTEK